MSNVSITKTPPVATKAPAAVTLWDAMRREMDEMFDRLAGDFTLPMLGRPRGLWAKAAPFVFAPAADFVEKEAMYTLAVELPGLTEKDVTLAVEGDNLVVRATRKDEKAEENDTYYMSERYYGAIERAFMLPERADRENITAEFKHGVLTVTLPKLPVAGKAAKAIEIKAA